MDPQDPTIRWLLEPRDPAIRYVTLTDLLGEPSESRIVRTARSRILQDPRVRALLHGQRPDGGFGVHPYQKWTGAHWRLVSLVELGLPPRHAAGRKAAGQVLAWLLGSAHRSAIRTIEGRVRRCASQEGNALAVCSRLGMAEDSRVETLARSLLEWQWPDGGWNCDKIPSADHSSFHETLAPTWGLLEYYRATEDRDVLVGAERARELFLRHRMFRSERTGEVVNPAWLRFHYPPYWHYDVLQGLLILSRLGPLTEPRLREALRLVSEKRRADGTWVVHDVYFRPPGRKGTGVEVVDWGRGGPSKLVTLNALRVLRAAGKRPGVS